MKEEEETVRTISITDREPPRLSHSDRALTAGSFFHAVHRSHLHCATAYYYVSDRSTGSSRILPAFVHRVAKRAKCHRLYLNMY